MARTAVLHPDAPALRAELELRGWQVGAPARWHDPDANERALFLTWTAHRPALVVTMSDATWADMLGAPLWHALADGAAHLAACGGGAVVLLLTLMAERGASAMANQAFGESALWAYARALAADYGRRGVRVNAVLSGYIEDAYLTSAPPSIRERHRTEIPLGRFGTPAEVAAAASFLASAAASYITGQTLIVDGGISTSAPLCWRLLGDGDKGR